MQTVSSVWVVRLRIGPVEGHGMTAKSAGKWAVGLLSVRQSAGEHRCPFSAIELKSVIRSSGTNAKHEISAITVCRAFRLPAPPVDMQVPGNPGQDLRSGRIRTRRNCGRQKLKSGLYIPILTLERTRHVLRDQQVALETSATRSSYGNAAKTEDCDGNKRHERYMDNGNNGHSA